MRPTSFAAACLLAAASCTSDEAPQSLVVDARVELCAVAPYSTPLEQVHDTQWRLDIEAGEYVLPDAQPLPASRALLSADGSPMPSLLDVRDVDGASPLDAALEGAILEHANLDTLPDDSHDLLLVWSPLDAMPGEPGQGRLTVAIEAEAGGDFLVDHPRAVRFACPDDGRGACPNRSFDSCDPGGPTVRTRVVLDRGEVVLDVRYDDRSPDNGDFAHVMFVASEIRVDEVELAHHDFFRLLHTATFPEIGDGAYAVLAPETLGPAGLGCGIVVADVGAEHPRAFTVDCALRELEPLAINGIAREVLR